MKLHILTLNWNGGAHLNTLYDGLVLNTSGFDCVWHIRDNGSTDNSIDELFKFSRGDKHVSNYLDIRDYRIGHNRDSFAKGVNYLYEQAAPAEDDLLLLLNNDIKFNDSNSLASMYALMRATDAAVVGAKLLYTNTNRLQHAGVIFGERYGRMPYHYRHNEESDAASNKNRYFQAVTAAVCLVKAGAFKEVGGMNEKFKWAFEDIDLCLKIGIKQKIAYCGETSIYHEESLSLKKNPVNKLFLNNNVKIFKETWFGKYELDHEKYLKSQSYNEIKI